MKYSDLNWRDQRKIKKVYKRYKYMMFYIAMRILEDDKLAKCTVRRAIIKLAKYVDKMEKVKSNKTKNFIKIVTEHIAIDLLINRNEE